ncbi:hypothetical protein F4V57_13990 [Acinetobacter qingfengensis]|uniref:Uncharacterized protein n=1 Tax=Acinetobacter qingfengensis TaxID=1262585 RepID=A0A1E7QYT5_9GAMM|nr:hypothetical protein [Acinetobacter qingfengensis]KAA8730963.1 hypothetical protein F4V57_13990 [Acinetobacter qingfengensis]OEY92258.1 hypothetical protein BJI46_05780 [Acinetobacter qingfengensis]
MSSSEKEIKFKTRQDFIQAAFNQVADIVAQHGSQILQCFCPAHKTQICLEQLSVVANEYSYDFSKIDIHVQNFDQSNTELAQIGLD